MITRKEIEENFKKNNEQFVDFELSVGWQETTTDILNMILDNGEFVQDGHRFCDVEYEPIRFDGLEVIVKVIVNDLTEYFNPDAWLGGDDEG